MPVKTRRQTDDDRPPTTSAKKDVPKTRVKAQAKAARKAAPAPKHSTSLPRMSTRTQTGKLPAKRKALEDLSPPPKIPRKTAPASADKGGTRAQPGPKVQGRSTHRTRAAPKSTVSARRTAKPKPKMKALRLTAKPKDPTTTTKRKREETVASTSDENEIMRQVKKKSKWKEPKRTDDKMHLPRYKPITEPPKKSFRIMVCGNNTSDELGLGLGKQHKKVSTPRVNPHLGDDVLNIACGGSHCIALTKDGEILTWGWNKDGTLGRETDFDPEKEDAPDEAAATPGRVSFDHLREQLTWSQVVATDHASFALTNDGRAFGWGTFYNDRGMQGFSPSEHGIQRRPVAIQGLSGITNLAAGAQHVLAINKEWRTFAWGVNNYGQLGERKLEDTDSRDTLRPRAMRLPGSNTRAKIVACGSHSSFALDQTGRVFAWGRNDHAQLGTGFDEDVRKVMKPTRVKALEGHDVTEIAAGKYHTLARDNERRLFVWGRWRRHALGLLKESLDEEKTVFDEEGEPLIVTEPTLVEGLREVSSVAAGKRHSIAIKTDGVAYTFGRSVELQTGQGTTKAVTTPRTVTNPEMKKMSIEFAAAGEDFSVFAGVLRGKESSDGECQPAKGLRKKLKH